LTEGGNARYEFVDKLVRRCDRTEMIRRITHFLIARGKRGIWLPSVRRLGGRVLNVWHGGKVAKNLCALCGV
jgi:hypothetical protein